MESVQTKPPEILLIKEHHEGVAECPHVAHEGLMEAYLTTPVYVRDHVVFMIVCKNWCLIAVVLDPS